ncbi:MAG: DivIVA domain-containing protein [Clostridia bacterium]|nr:DivIVA domain-containing protein [Clostridia bacterium]
MLTPIDIQNKEFSKSLSGYNKDMVDDFMSEVANEFEKLYKENIELKDRLSVLNDSLKKYRAMEDSLQNTLMFAQNTAEDVKKNAKEKADFIVGEASTRAETIIRDAERKCEEIQKKYDSVLAEFVTFKTKFNSLLDSEKNLMEEMFK